MDPMSIFPHEVTDIILSNLTASEILTSTQVSRTWNEVIGSSPAAMQKILLSLYWTKKTNFLNENIWDALMESKRKYHNIDFRYKSQHIDDIAKILTTNNRQWKYARFERLNFHSTAHAANFFKLIEDTVEKLELRDIYVASHSCISVNINFKRLKVLRIKHINGRSLLENSFANCRRLEELSVNSSYYSKEPLQKLLKQNPNLKRLNISMQMFNEIFTLNVIKEIPFKLRALKAKDAYFGGSSVEKTLIPFLERHIDSLEKLTLDCIDSEALKLIYHIPKLKILRIGSIYFNDSSTNLQLCVNQSIEVLSYYDDENRLNKMESIMKASPNVRELNIFSLTDEMVSSLATYAKELEKLSLRTIDVTALTSRELFPKLKNVQVEIISSSFEDHLLAIPEVDRNVFVKSILNSNYVMLH